MLRLCIIITSVPWFQTFYFYLKQNFKKNGKPLFDSSHILRWSSKILLCTIILNQALPWYYRRYKVDKKIVKENIPANQNRAFVCHVNKIIIYIRYYHINIMSRYTIMCLQPTTSYPNKCVYHHFYIRYKDVFKKYFPYIRTLFQYELSTHLNILYTYNNPNSWSPVARKIFCRQFELSFPNGKSC